MNIKKWDVELKKIFTQKGSEKEMISQIFKEFKQNIRRETNIIIKKHWHLSYGNHTELSPHWRRHMPVLHLEA